MSDRAKLLRNLQGLERDFRSETHSGRDHAAEWRAAADLLRAVAVATEDLDAAWLRDSARKARTYLKAKKASPSVPSGEWLAANALAFDTLVSKSRGVDPDFLACHMLDLIDGCPLSRLGRRLAPRAKALRALLRSSDEEERAVRVRVTETYRVLLDRKGPIDGEALIRHGFAAWLQTNVTTFKNLFVPAGRHGTVSKRRQ